MNGRVYDPEIGRFMSVDPVFQFPENLQSLNPYSYVLNNPLGLTDPSGYCTAATGSNIKTCKDVTAVMKDGSTKDLGRHNTRNPAAASNVKIPGLESKAARPGSVAGGNGSGAGQGMKIKPSGTNSQHGPTERGNVDAPAVGTGTVPASQAEASPSPAEALEFHYADKSVEQWTPIAKGKRVVGFEPASPAMAAFAEVLTTLFPGNVPAFVGGFDATPLLANIRLEQQVIVTTTEVSQGDQLIASLNNSVAPTRNLREVFYSSDWKTGSTQVRSEWLMRGPTTRTFPGVDDAIVRSRWRAQGVTIGSDGMPAFVSRN